jgi:hypothetical protein
MADRNVADVVREMSADYAGITERDRRKAQKSAQQSRIDEEAEVAKRGAVAILDERDRRDAAWFDTHLGSLTPAQYRQYCRERFGFDPGV